MDTSAHTWPPVHLRPEVDLQEARVTYGPADVPGLGPMVVGRSGHGLCVLAFPGQDAWRRLVMCTRGAMDLEEAPGPVPLDGPLVAYGTAFQHKVWAAACAVPAGATATYGDLSRVAGGCPRAVGAALGANPLAVAIPCHRVVRADGSMGGYAWGGARKRALLRAEGADV
jgi:AraC family transcriptional regulator, regulatory protein of adaptative response / methylated-DNA-[protein]-cysteine methyltransferase